MASSSCWSSSTSQLLRHALHSAAIVLCFLALLVDSTTAAAVPMVADGKRCVITTSGNHLIACRTGRTSCVVHTTPSLSNKFLVGTCNASYTRGSYCQYMSIAYAVGTKGIRGNSACDKCDCTLHPERKFTNKATCDCKPTGTCYLNRQGKFARGSSCSGLQSMCVVTKVGGGGRDAQGNRIDLGKCIAPEMSMSSCTSAGPTWANKFYAQGVSGVPFPGDACRKCTCSATGMLLNCVTDPTCIL